MSDLENNKYKAARIKLVNTLQQQGITREDVLQVIQDIPREVFISEDLQHLAYENNPLPIGYQQTISQPYIVAYMTEKILDLAPKKILEIGTGSGYQTAILAKLIDKVYSVETIYDLYQTAKQRLYNLNMHNVELRCGNGRYGWWQFAPYPAIMVTAAALELPEVLIKQLTIGGKMIIPLGKPWQQKLYLITKTNQSTYKQEALLDVSFVPLVEE